MAAEATAVTRLSGGDEDLHEPSDATLHRFDPPGIPDPERDRAYLARLLAHLNAHDARNSAPSMIGPLVGVQEDTVEIVR